VPMRGAVAVGRARLIDRTQRDMQKEEVKTTANAAVRNGNYTSVGSALPHRRRDWGSPLPHRDCCKIVAGTGLALATSAPGPGPGLTPPHLHRDRDRGSPRHICAGTGQAFEAYTRLLAMDPSDHEFMATVACNRAIALVYDRLIPA
jgi:hypothetical protein